jgi:hypothetical protein
MWSRKIRSRSLQKIPIAYVAIEKSVAKKAAKKKK